MPELPKIFRRLPITYVRWNTLVNGDHAPTGTADQVSARSALTCDSSATNVSASGAAAVAAVTAWIRRCSRGRASARCTAPIRIAGATVLCVLGAQPLWTLRKPPADAAPRRTGASFAIGVASSLGNPKAGVFAVSLIPQFVTADGPVLASSIALGTIWAAVSGTWFTLYVWTADKGRARVNRPAVRRVLRAATGVTVLGLSIAAALG